MNSFTATAEVYNNMLHSKRRSPPARRVVAERRTDTPPRPRRREQQRPAVTRERRPTRSARQAVYDRDGRRRHRGDERQDRRAAVRRCEGGSRGHVRSGYRRGRPSSSSPSTCMTLRCADAAARGLPARRRRRGAGGTAHRAHRAPTSSGGGPAAPGGSTVRSNGYRDARLDTRRDQ